MASYLELLYFQNSFAPQSVVFKSPITGQLFEDIQQYYDHIFDIKFKQFSSVFTNKTGNFITCLNHDLQILSSVFSSPFSYFIQIFLNENILPRRGELIFPGDLIEFQDHNYVILGLQGEQIIARQCDFGRVISFKATQGISAGKLALFDQLTPVLECRKVLNSLNSDIDVEKIGFDQFDFQQFVQGFDNYEEVYSTLEQCFQQIEQYLTNYLTQIIQFKVFEQQNLAFGRISDDNISFISSQNINGCLSQHPDSSQIELLDYSDFIKDNVNFFNKRVTKEQDDKKLSLFEQLDNQDQKFIQFIIDQNQDELIAEFKKLSIIDKPQFEQPDLEEVFDQIFQESRQNFSPQIVSIYQFFYHFAHLLEMKIVDIKDFTDALEVVNIEPVINKFEPLYNQSVQPFIYQLICRLIHLLFLDEEKISDQLFAVKNDNQDSDDIYSFNWIINSECNQKSIIPQHIAKEDISVTDSNTSQSNSNQSPSSTSDEYSYDDTIDDFIESGSNDNSDISDSYDNSQSKDSDYIIIEEKTKKNTKKMMANKKQSKIQNTINKKKGQIPTFSVKQNKNQQTVATDDNDDKTIKQIKQDVIQIIPLSNKEELGSIDEIWIEKLLYYISEVSVPNKDLFAIQFISVLLNHLTDQYDETFHRIYSKIESFQYYSFNTFHLVKKSKLQYQFEDIFLKQFWQPDFSYPTQTFMNYQKYYRQNIDITYHIQTFSDEDLENFNAKIQKRIDRQNRQNIIFEKLFPHPILKFAQLDIQLKLKFINWLINQVLQSDKLIQIQNNAFQKYQELSTQTKQLRIQLTYFTRKDFSEQRQLQYTQSHNALIKQLKDLTVCSRNMIKIKNLEEQISETIGDFEAKLKSQLEITLAENERSLFDYYNLAFSGNIFTDAKTNSQIIHAGDYYLYKNGKLVQISDEQLYKIQLLMDRNSKFLFNNQENSYYDFNLQFKKFGKKIYCKDVNQLAKDIGQISRYQLDNNYDIGQMRLSKSAFQDVLEDIE